LEGGGEAYFDHIYLGRSIEDLDRVTERMGDGPAANPCVPGQAPGDLEAATSLSTP